MDTEHGSGMQSEREFDDAEQKGFRDLDDLVLADMPEFRVAGRPAGYA